MSKLQELINYLLKEEIEEVAKTIGEAESANLALFVKNTRIYLYQPELAKKMISDITSENAQYAGYLKLTEHLNKWLPDYQKILELSDNLDPEQLNIATRIVNLGQIINRPYNEKWQNFVINRYQDIIKTHNILKTYFRLALKQKLKVNERIKWQFNWQKGFDKLIEIRDYLYPNDVDPTELMLKSIIIGGIGTIQYFPSEDCNPANTYTVKASAAEQGWGPLLYDIVMSIIRPKWLIADRGSISDAALSVWEFYLKNRTDVEKEIIPDIITGKCKLPMFAETNGFDELNDTLEQYRGQNLITKLEELLADIPVAWRFKIKNPVNYKALIDNHNNFIRNQSVVISGETYDFDEQLFEKAANLFFNSRYDE